jgi:peptidoglycan/xylan/chitin deacetylase (PgdA/CDA1 family)
MKVLIWFFLSFLARQLVAQEIAITFDDAPTGDGPVFNGEERSERILTHLKNYKVNEVAFFVFTGNIDNENNKRLLNYTKAGHLLGNHTHSHQWMHQIGTTAYVEDLKRADGILRSYKVL